MNFVTFLAWIVNASDIIGWTVAFVAVGGFTSSYLAGRYARNNSDILTWGGVLLAFALALITYFSGVLDTRTGQIGALLILAAVMIGYGFVMLPYFGSMKRPRSKIMDLTVQRYRFEAVFGHFTSHVILLIWSLIVIAPFWVMIVNSLKPKREIARTPFEFPSADIRTTESYEQVWLDGSFGNYFKNSLAVSINSILIILIVGTLAAYALSNWRSRKSTAVYLYFITGLMIPIRLGTINIVSIVQDLGLSGRLESLIPIYVAMGVPIAVFVLTSFMRDIPQDLIDAARMDGASEIRVLWEIIVPLVRPALATVAIFNFIPIYNDLWFPLILTRAESVRTVTYGVSLLFGQYQSDWADILATLSLASTPVLILYLLMSKQFIRGLTAGAVKG